METFLQPLSLGTCSSSHTVQPWTMASRAVAGPEEDSTDHAFLVAFTKGHWGNPGKGDNSQQVNASPPHARKRCLGIHHHNQKWKKCSALCVNMAHTSSVGAQGQRNGGATGLRGG